MASMTYREAAHAVRRSVRTIKRWRRSGMPMTWDLRHGQKVRVVDEDVLFAWLRDRLDAWPSHQYRLRRLQAAAASTTPNG